MSTMRLHDEMTLQQMHDAVDTFLDQDPPYWIQDDRSPIHGFHKFDTAEQARSWLDAFRAANPKQ